jgi:hypothetical protein
MTAAGREFRVPVSSWRELRELRWRLTSRHGDARTADRRTMLRKRPAAARPVAGRPAGIDWYASFTVAAATGC